ncbi:MAG: hypothetical protein ACI4M9_00400 [Succinivibrio sp.]
MLKKAFLIAMTASVLAGCSSEVEMYEEEQRPPIAPTSIKPQNKILQVNTLDPVIDADIDVRRGAAIEEGGAKHYLSKEEIGDNSPLLQPNVKYDRRNPQSYTNMSDMRQNTSYESNVGKEENEAKQKILRNFQIGSIQDYSYYELSRWQRFCDHGKDMNVHDWRFVKKKNHLFPRELLDKCIPPSETQSKRYGFRFK